VRYARLALADGHTAWARVLDDGRFARLDGNGQSALPDVDAPPRETVERTSVRLLAPAVPGKIVCVGRNYAAHAKELGNAVPDEPKLFMKPPSSVIGPDETIVRPLHMSALVHHEGELAVIMGKRARHVDADEALSYVFGYTCANDVTARDLQRKDEVFTRAKGFDTFCPLGPLLVGAEEVPDPQALEVTVRVGDALRQSGRTADMVFSVASLIAFISAIMTLEPGDVILTGTPEGVGPLEQGDRVEVEIPGVGRLENPVENGPMAPS